MSNLFAATKGKGGTSGGGVYRLGKTLTLEIGKYTGYEIDISGQVPNFRDVTIDNITIQFNQISLYYNGEEDIIFGMTYSYDNTRGIITLNSSSASSPFGTNTADRIINLIISIYDPNYVPPVEPTIKYASGVITFSSPRNGINYVEGDITELYPDYTTLTINNITVQLVGRLYGGTACVEKVTPWEYSYDNINGKIRITNLAGSNTESVNADWFIYGNDQDFKVTIVKEEE